MFTIFFVLLAGTILVMVLSAKQGRMWFGYGMLCFILSPVIVGLLLLCLGKTDNRKVAEMVKLRELEAKALGHGKPMTVASNDADLEESARQQAMQERIEAIASARRTKGLNA